MLKGVQVMFKSVLFWKIVTLLGLMLLMMIPKGMLLHVIDERSGYRQSVIDKVSDSTSRSQKNPRSIDCRAV